MSAERFYWMRVALWCVVLVFVGALLIGCDADIPVSGDNQDIREFKLSDGTRCVLYRFRGGITCDWKQQ